MNLAAVNLSASPAGSTPEISSDKAGAGPTTENVPHSFVCGDARGFNIPRVRNLGHAGGLMGSGVQDDNGIWWRAACLLPTCGKSISFLPSSSIADTIQVVRPVGTFQPPHEQHGCFFFPKPPTTVLAALTIRFRDDRIYIHQS